MQFAIVISEQDSEAHFALHQRSHNHRALGALKDH